MRAIALRSLIFGCVGLCVATHSLAASEPLRTAENDQFEIVAQDLRSVYYVDELSQYIVEIASRYLEPSAMAFPQRVLIRLKPEKYVDFEGDYQIQIGERGFVSLDLRWGDELKLPTLCRAVAKSLLVRYSILKYGADRLGQIPEWPASAIGIETYLTLRPGLSQELAVWSGSEPILKVESLIRRKWQEAAVDGYGYVLLLAMKRSGLERSELKQLFARALSGDGMMEALEKLIQPKGPAEGAVELEDWWQTSASEILRPDNGLIESMEVSRNWISELSDMTTVAEGEYNLHSIWKQRDNQQIRDVIQARYEILKLRLLRVNPAYFNAARSLGRLFEAYLSDGRSYEYVHSLTIFLSDFEDTKRLEEVVVESLQ